LCNLHCSVATVLIILFVNLLKVLSIPFLVIIVMLLSQVNFI